MFTHLRVMRKGLFTSFSYFSAGSSLMLYARQHWNNIYLCVYESLFDSFFLKNYSDRAHQQSYWVGVGRANVGIFYSFLLSHLVPTETTICRLVSTYIRVSKSFLKIKCLHLLMGESLEEGSAGKYSTDDQRRIGQVWSQQFHPAKVSEAQRLNYRKTWPALPQHYQG